MTSIIDRTIFNKIDSNKRESYSLLDMSKTHQKGILLFGLTKEFNALSSSSLYLIKKII